MIRNFTSDLIPRLRTLDIYWLYKYKYVNTYNRHVGHASAISRGYVNIQKAHVLDVGRGNNTII